MLPSCIQMDTPEVTRVGYTEAKPWLSGYGLDRGGSPHVKIRLLGPLEVCGGSRWTDVRTPKLRSRIGHPLLRSRQVVSTEQLVLALWGETPPKTATTQVHGY